MRALGWTISAPGQPRSVSGGQHHLDAWSEERLEFKGMTVGRLGLNLVQNQSKRKRIQWEFNGIHRKKRGKEVLRQLEFDHHRMTSGAVVRCGQTQRIYAFFKGAYDKMAQIAEPSSVPRDYKELCEQYAQQCFYLLAMLLGFMSHHEL